LRIIRKSRFDNDSHIKVIALLFAGSGVHYSVAHGFRFPSRREAGKALARRLLGYTERPDVHVLALPRGGVPVAYEVADALRVPLDVFTVRKLGVPGQPELAMGAVASGGVALIDARLIQALGIGDEDISAVVEREIAELHRREAAYRSDRAPLDVRGKTVVLVDDGVATGASMRAAIESLRAYAPRAVIVAVPVGAADTCQQLRRVADDVVCDLLPDDLVAVGAHYEDFRQISDDEVRELLAEEDRRMAHWRAIM
jgi:predicted phosphoribosyltransferase